MTPELTAYLTRCRERVDQALTLQMEQLPALAPTLLAAMRYSLFASGKRIRPALSYAGADAVASLLPAIAPAVDRVACALECIHTYSLIHDDLPAMDNDDLRRGLPTCHIAHGEATAILAGDALQTLAFQILTQATPTSVGPLCQQLATASGAGGMIAGQALDLAAITKTPTLTELEQVHRAKTGALIKASVVMGALATEQASDEQLTALGRYGDAIGLAFQVQDDILDVVGDTQVLGKQAGADAALDKPTYVSLLGLDQARSHARRLHQQAMDALTPLDARAQPLRDLSAYIVDRVT